MNDKQENKLTMYYAVQKVVNDFQSTWSANVPFATVYGLFKANVPLIEQKRNVQMLKNTGAASEKSTKRLALEDSTYFIANRTQSYALAVSDEELYAMVNLNRSALTRARDTDLSGMAANILAKAKEHAAVLIPYGVTSALLTELDALANAYASLLAKPRVAKLTTKAATVALGKLIKDSDALLNKRLDREIVVYMKSNVDFHSQYVNARKVVGTGYTKLAVKGNITDADSKEPIKGVRLAFTNAFEGAKLGADAKAVHFLKKTTAKGNFQWKNIPLGTYELTVTNSGYAPQLVTVHVAEGERVKVAVVMEKKG